MRAVWLTDIHLNFLSPVQLDRFYTLVRQQDADCVLISGDIAEAPRLAWFLRQLHDRIQCPIYFVLGNHDYYSASFGEVYDLISDLVHENTRLEWLSSGGIHYLTPGIGLIGHDGWADGRYGDYVASPVMLNDYVAIRDLAGLSKMERLQKLHAKGDDVAAYFREWLPKALQSYEHVILITHVPPYEIVCWNNNQPADPYWLPHFACKAVGETLSQIMEQHPQQQLTVLCGHTHSQVRVQILPNLEVVVGGAIYGKPQIQQVFNWL